MTRRALVLGGGGITGIAWETGFLAGLAESGLDLTAGGPTPPDLVVGTSAGSIVGSQVTSEVPVAELYRRQLLPPAQLGDGGVPLAAIGPRVLLTFAASLLRARGDVERFGRLLGERAVAAARAGRVPSVEERYAQVRQRLVTQAWPGEGAPQLVVTGVDAATGRRVAFSGPGGELPGVGLEDAVNASCAVPCVYPPIPIAGRTYLDGGVHSGSNADLAAGCDVVLALCPADRAVGPLRSASQALAGLGVPHLVVTPDDASRAAIGRNVLDPQARPPSARAGFEQGVAWAERVGDLWRGGPPPT
ncbi:patatin-like phospholipase family protein [Nocardioides nanhaiensis]|uniref:Patatin-like phospholipase family protein n=1 Tax=Nocardioides nanhaiensis TaxID=1476871 RepID=A0ABP8VS10_9ACTN